MTKEMVEQAIRVSIRNAFYAGKLTKFSDNALHTSLSYANGVILPVVEALIEQAIEDAWQAHLKSVPVPAEQQS